MAYDKVVDSAQLEAAIKATADAIREKTGDTALIDWVASKGFADVISAIEAGGGMPVKAYGTITLSEDQTDNYIIDTGVYIENTDILFVIFNHNVNERVQGSLLYAHQYGRSATSSTAVSAGYRAGAANTIYQSSNAGIVAVLESSKLKLGGNATANFSYGLKAGYKYLWVVMEGA